MKEHDISMSPETAVTIVEKQAVTVESGPPELPTLSPREAMFVAAYIGQAHFNATEAARLTGSTEVSANTVGPRMVQYPHVRAHIDAYLDAEILSAKEVLHEWSKMARAPTSHFMQLQESEYIDERGIVHKAVVRLDYAAKNKALEGLARYHGIADNRIQLDIAIVPKRYVDVSDDDL